jgi:hypothetical protein
MKMLLLGSLLLGTTTSFAQSMNVNELKNLFTAKKAILERVNAGMTKKIITTSSEGACGLMTTATQIILKIDGAKMFILSKEKLQPQNTPACRTAGYTTSAESNIVYVEDKPSLDNDLSDLDATASSIKVISKAGEIVTMNVEVSVEDESGTANTEKVTIKYDLTKPSFKNMISSQSINYKTVIEDSADSDLSKVDLTKVSFCDNNDGDESECVEGDFSDILF